MVVKLGQSFGCVVTLCRLPTDVYCLQVLFIACGQTADHGWLSTIIDVQFELCCLIYNLRKFSQGYAVKLLLSNV